MSSHILRHTQITVTLVLNFACSLVCLLWLSHALSHACSCSCMQDSTNSPP